MNYYASLGNKSCVAEVIDPFFLAKHMDLDFKKTGLINFDSLKEIHTYIAVCLKFLSDEIIFLSNAYTYCEQYYCEKIVSCVMEEIEDRSKKLGYICCDLFSELASSEKAAKKAKEDNIREPLNQDQYQELASSEIHKFLKFIDEKFGLSFIQKDILDQFTSMANGLSHWIGLDAVNHFTSKLSRINREINSFERAFSKAYNQIDFVKNAFFSQNISYVNGDVDYAKIYRISKKNFGYDNFMEIIWWGSIVHTIMSVSEVEKEFRPSNLQSGLNFEKHVEKLYIGLGYSVSTTPITGDFGVDLLATSNTEKIAIQCKKYATPVGPDAVMQVYSGGAYYGCTRFSVFSVNGFTNAATEMASKLRVELFNIKLAV